MFKTIGIFAHVDAGKTTFAEQLLFATNAIKAAGRVDHQNTFLDNDELERTRGITIFAEQGRFKYNDCTYHMIDTPGHVDFSPEMERSIAILDAAVIVVSAVERVQGHTETVWQLLRAQQIPTIFFINKMDREGASFEQTMMQIQQLLSPDAIAVDETFVSAVAERHEEVLDAFIADDVSDELLTYAVQQLIQDDALFPVFSGVALHGDGIDDVLRALDRFVTTTYNPVGDVQANVFKIRHEHDQRLTFIKLKRGTLHVRDDITIRGKTYKILEIRTYNGQRFESVPQAVAGDVVALKGLHEAIVGDVIGDCVPQQLTLTPTLQAKLHVRNTIHVKEVLAMLRELEAEEPTLRVTWHERHQEIQLHVMGVIQLEVLTHVLRERYNLDVTFDTPTILYMETIAAPAYGYGHFEPLKHYAEVHLHVAPNARGRGMTFTNRCHADDLTTGHMRLIEQHVFEREHHGLLTGSPMTDIHVTLLNGAAHAKHTAGGDFREATHRALRQACEQVENVLLEPYYRFRLRAAIDHLGRMMSDVQQASGTFDAPVLTEHDALLTGRVPVATFMHYATTFLAYTNGKGAISLQFDGYDVCHNVAEVIERIGYNKDADPDYTSSSIFCAKGKGYSVHWTEAAEAMHCVKKTLEES
ncbi:MAG: translation factor GTPase family protein [Caryophanon sp.]|nr:translation factor GTPase family protein [Caryophanon sp.]